MLFSKCNVFVFYLYAIIKCVFYVSLSFFSYYNVRMFRMATRQQARFKTKPQKRLNPFKQSMERGYRNTWAGVLARGKRTQRFGSLKHSLRYPTRKKTLILHFRLNSISSCWLVIFLHAIFGQNVGLTERSVFLHFKKSFALYYMIFLHVKAQVSLTHITDVSLFTSVHIYL